MRKELIYYLFGISVATILTSLSINLMDTIFPEFSLENTIIFSILGIGILFYTIWNANEWKKNNIKSNSIKRTKKLN